MAPKSRPRIDLAQAVKGMDKALKRETSTLPRASALDKNLDKKKSPPSISKADLAAIKRLRGKASLH